MKLLLILLSVMTWTVESKDAVSGQGTWPYDIEVSYSNTYQKGQVRAGDEAVLTLSNLGGIMVQKVEVYVKSNKNAGAGTFQLSFQPSAYSHQISGSFKDWFGVFDNENFHALNLLSESQEGVNILQIKLTGTENSLTIYKYVITYSPGAPHTVTLMNGDTQYDELTEEQGMSGVVLPKLDDLEDWKFTGWSEKEFWTLDVATDVLSANSKYYPIDDCMLWAVYEYRTGEGSANMTDIQSGRYIYWNTNTKLAMSGTPKSGRLTTINADPANEQQQYDVEFNASGDSATIQHVPTGIYIGYDGTKVVESKRKWLVYHEGEKTAFYIHYGEKTYILWPDIMSEGNPDYAGLYKISGDETLKSTSTALMSAKTATGDTSFTCHPESPKGLEGLMDERMSGVENIMHMGNYDFIIKNGQKFLIFRQ